MKFPILIFCLFLFTNGMGQGNFKTEIKNHRIDYKIDFTKHDYSPFYHSPEAMQELHFFPSKKKYKVTARIERVTDKTPVQIKTYSNKEKTFIKYAWAHFKIKGKPYKLALYQNMRNMAMPQYKDLLFLPFKDFSNSEETYGGGRYLDLDLKDIQDDQLIIDFNKCYNPYCAYSDGYNCPVPPLENHLEIKIPAGEKMYTGPKLHRQK